MTFRTLLLMMLAFIAVTSACSDDKKNNIRLEEFTIIDSNGSLSPQKFEYDNVSALNLQTTTRLQASTYLLNDRDPLHIELSGQFMNSKSMMAVNAYTTSLTTNDGTRLEFTSVNNGIDVHLFTRDYPTFHFCTIPDALATNGLFNVRLQFSYVKGVGPRILIWNNYNDGKNKRKKNFEYFDASNSDCNSQSKVFMDYFGGGRLWGIEIHQTRLQETKRSEYLL